MAPPEDDHSGESQEGQPNLSKGELGPVREDATGTALQTAEMPGGPLVPLSTRPKILTVPPNVTEILNSFRRQWRLAVILGISLAIPVALATWFLVPIQYTAQSLMQSRSNTLIFDDLQNAEESGWEAQEQLIRGFQVLNTALNDGLMELEYIKEAQKGGIDPVDYLAKTLLITVPDDEKERKGYGGQILRIAMNGDDPQQLRKILVAVTDAYLSQVINEERLEWLKQRDELKSQYDRSSDILRIKREDLQVLAKQVGTSDPETASATQQLLIDQVLYLRRQISEARDQVVQKERDRKTYEQQVGWVAHTGSILPEDIEAEIAQNEDLAAYNERLAELEEDLETYRQIYRDPKAEPIQAREKVIAQLQDEQAAFAQQLRNEILASFRRGERKSDVELEHERLMAEANESKAYLETLTAEYKELADDVEELANYSAELETKRDELTFLTEVTGELGYKLEKLELELNANQGRVRRIPGGIRLPKTGDTSKRDQLTFAATLVALALGIAAPTALDVIKRKVSTVEQMSEGLGIRVLGNLPLLDKPKRKWGFRAPTSESLEELQVAMEESIDGLRAMLLHLPAAKDVRALMVTSAIENEGKTTLASTLAMSMGRSGRRTLLIDGDLRRPSAHRFLEMPLEEGLAEVLRGDVALERAVRPSPMPGLRFLSAGHCDPTSLQALTKDNLEEVFEKVREEFDFIIVDSAPVLAVVDSLLIGKQCDAAILSVTRDKSRVAPIYETSERLRATRIPVLGCVFNGKQSGVFAPDYYAYGYSPAAAATEDTSDEA